MFLRDIQEKKEVFSKAKNTIQYLVFFDELAYAEILNKEMKSFEESINYKVRTFNQKMYETQHPEVSFVYQEIDFINS
jgi:hypothetical protein